MLSTGSKRDETRFAGLLRVIQQEHDKELDSLRSEFEYKLEAAQKELLDIRSMADSQIQRVKNERVQQPVRDSDDGIQDPDVQNPEYEEQNLVKAPDTNWHTPETHGESPLRSPAVVPSEGIMDDQVQNADAKAKEDEEKSSRAPVPFISEFDEESRHVKEEEHKSNELATLKNYLRSRRSSRRLLVDDTRLPLWRQKLIEFVSWSWFEAACVFCIFSNAVVMGIQIDYTVSRESNPYQAPFGFRLIDRVYTTWFIVELLIRLLAFGLTFFYRSGWAWNLLDFIVVLTDAFQTFTEIVLLDDGSGSSLENFTALRMLRILRVTRAVRVVRLVRFFRELRMMITSVMKCGTSLMWSIIMFTAIIYTFSIFLMTAVGFYVYENKNNKYYQHYRDYWDTLPKGMWTLFSCMTGGVSWAEVGDPLLHIGWVYGCTLGFFMFFTIFVVTNIITGIFVDTAIQSAQHDREEVIMEKLHDRDTARKELQHVFEHSDTDQSGTLTLDEFEASLQDERVRAHLHSLGLQVDEARALFKLLDIDRSNEISIEEYLFGCMRLKGGATSIDLATLMYEHKRLVAGIKKFHNHVIYSLELMHQKLDQDGKFTEPFTRRAPTSVNTLHQNAPLSARDYMQGMPPPWSTDQRRVVCYC